MWLILAKASPRKPYVAIEARSSKVLIFEVVCRSHRIARSSFYEIISLRWCGIGRLILRYLNTAPVVCDLEQLQTTLFDKDFQ